MANAAVDEPPAFLQLAAHPVRWRLLRELVTSDRAVGELTAALGEQQSLVSYHLGQLRLGGLVRSRRSSADGRDTYYTVDLGSCGEQLRATGSALHPGLSSAPTTTAAKPARRPRVLFLCTGNSSRSQIAEAMLMHALDGRVDVASAGSAPKPVHPLAVRVMHERGIDISGNRSKHLDGFVGRRFDVVITLCDRVREVCPEFTSHPDLVHWSIADPAAEGTNERERYRAFVRTADELETRIGFLVPQLTKRR